MKNKLLVLLLVFIMILPSISCNNDKINSETKNIDETDKAPANSDKKPIQEKEDAPNPLDDYPTVTYDDISSGQYNGQKICIDAIIDKIDFSSTGTFSFSLWYPTQSSYIYVNHLTNSFYNIQDTSPEFVLTTAQNGDVIKFATTVNNDGSFGTSELEAAEIIGKCDLNTIYDTYKTNCPDMDYNSIQRNPSNYENTTQKISGTILQIIDENAYSSSYLLSTELGYVYLSWFENESIRGSRFLEGDNITVYGTFSMLKTYSTPIGTQNTVPELSVHIIELQ